MKKSSRFKRWLKLSIDSDSKENSLNLVKEIFYVDKRNETTVDI